MERMVDLESRIGIRYAEIIRSMKDKDYLFYAVNYALAPVEKGIKPASVLNFSKNFKDMYGLWKRYKSDFYKNNMIEFVTININNDRELVLFYNNKILESTIYDEKNMEFLKNYGYRKNMSLDECIMILRRRFDEEFPHEIGVLLGIPVRDVEEFIKNSGRNYLLSGYWKVYHDVDRALNIFKAYDMAKLDFIIQNGTYVHK